MSFASLVVGKRQLEVTACEVVWPYQGAWTARLSIPSKFEVSGPVQLAFDAGNGSPVSLFGHITTGDAGSQHEDDAHVIAVGGAGGLAKMLEPRTYRTPQARLVIDDIVADAGETLALGIDGSLLEATLPAWVRSTGRASEALTLVVAQLGLQWRVRADGKIWIGRDAWPDIKLEATIIDHDPAARRIVISSDLPSMVPGTTWRGLRIYEVSHSISADGIRSSIRYETDLAIALAGAVRGVIGPSVETSRLYPGKVIAQSSAGVDVMLDQPAPVKGLSGVPLRHGLPGCEVKVPQGARVRVGFDGGSRTKPFAALWDDAGPVTEIKIAGSSSPVARSGDLADAGFLIVSSGLVVAYLSGETSTAERTAALAAAGGGAAGLTLTAKINLTGSKLKA